jgi:hypothetical protein
MVSWREREARNEVRFRNQNEWIESTTASFGSEVLTAFVCECGDEDCHQTIELTTSEYELVRSSSNRFALAINHENPESEAVVREYQRFAMVEKIEGWGLRLSRETDPRGARRSAQS